MRDLGLLCFWLFSLCFPCDCAHVELLWLAVGTAQSSHELPHRSQYQAFGDFILRHVPQSHPVDWDEAIASAIRRRNDLSLEWCLCSVLKIPPNCFELSGDLPVRCKNQALRASARLLRDALLCVVVAVADGREDHQGKDQDEVPEG